jgi:putative transposase
MRYRRAKVKGGTYFFTVVTHRRIKIFAQSDNVELLRQVFKKVKERHPFKIDAFVLLPDHLHCIWTLPKGDADFSTRWRLIKSYFGRQIGLVGWLEGRNPTNTTTSASRLRKKEQTIWQRRFWEHLIRNHEDLRKHVEYIHYNPVRHGLTKTPGDWEYSSFHRYVDKGIYNINWGADDKMKFDETVGYE